MLCLQRKTTWFLLCREVISVDCGAGVNKTCEYIVWAEHSLLMSNQMVSNSDALYGKPFGTGISFNILAHPVLKM